MCDDVSLAALASECGTPLYVYSAQVIRERYLDLDSAFAAHPHRVHYALKANSTLAVVRLLRQLGARADVNSGGEIDVAMKAGFTPSEMVFTGVGKTRAELERAVAIGVDAINVESPGEVERLDAIARATNTRPRIAIRINPDIEAGTHPHISTGHRATKFGVSVDTARAIARDVASHRQLHLVGLHVHIGSQINSAMPLSRAARTVSSLATELAAEGITLEHLDVGGGLGIGYGPLQSILSIDEYAHALLRPVAKTGLALVLEPGRWIVGPAGVLLTSVVDIKGEPGDRPFVIVDAGMTDLLRPALYGAWHGIEAVTPRGDASVLCDVVGPVCETSDTLGVDRKLPPLEIGDVLAIRDTGAYGSVMASNYNRRPMAAEVLVDGSESAVIRRRQTVDDMMQWDAPC